MTEDKSKLPKNFAKLELPPEAVQRLKSLSLPPEVAQRLMPPELAQKLKALSPSPHVKETIARVFKIKTELKRKAEELRQIEEWLDRELGPGWDPTRRSQAPAAPPPSPPAPKPPAVKPDAVPVAAAPPDTAAKPVTVAPQKKLSPAEWLAAARKEHPRLRRERMSDWVDRLHKVMEAAPVTYVWVKPTLRRRLYEKPNEVLPEMTLHRRP